MSARAFELRTVEYKNLTDDQNQPINHVPKEPLERAVTDEICRRHRIEVDTKKEVKHEVYTDDVRRKMSDGKKLVGQCNCARPF